MPTMYPHCVLGIDGYLADCKTDIGFVICEDLISILFVLHFLLNTLRNKCRIVCVVDI